VSERDLFLVRESLAAEQQHRILVEGADDLLERRIVQAPDVDVQDLEAEEWMERPRLDRHIDR
jgi:hypothetical protein